MFENAQELHRTPFLPTRCPLAYNWTTKWTTGRFLSRGGRAKNQKVSNFPGNLARPPRLERGTLCLEGRCSIQLSYGRLVREDTHGGKGAQVPQSSTDPKIGIIFAL